MTRPLVLLGVSNTVGDLIELAQACGYQVEAIVLNAPEVVRPRTLTLEQRLARLAARPAIVPLASYEPRSEVEHLIAPVGHKREIAQTLADRNLSYATLVHPSALVSPSAQVGVGAIIGAGTVVGSLAVIGEHVTINRLVFVGHDSTIGDFSRLAAGCRIAGQVRVGSDVTVGMGGTLLEEIEVGDGAVIAAGAVVRGDVAAFTMVAGVPATVKRGPDVP